MKNVIHFAKVLGICWAAAMVAYLFVVLRGSFNFVIAWYGTSRPPMWLTQMLFWLWPVFPALLIAGSWEILRVIRLRIVR